jgi:hypothetical protein
MSRSLLSQFPQAFAGTVAEVFLTRIAAPFASRKGLDIDIEGGFRRKPESALARYFAAAF